MGATATNAFLLAMLMVIAVVSCGEDVVTSLNETEITSDHQLVVEFVKMKLLDGLGLAQPPQVANTTLKEDLRNLPLSSYLRGRRTETPLTQPGRKLSRVVVFAELGSSRPCQGPKGQLKNQTSLSFKMPTDPALVHSAILQFKTGRGKRIFKPEVSLSICSCPAFGNNTASEDLMTGLRISNGGCWPLSSTVETNNNGSLPKMPMRSAKRGWSYVRLGRQWKLFVSGVDKRLDFLVDGEMTITERMRPTLVLEVAKEKPRVKVHPSRMKRSNRGPERDECATLRRKTKKKNRRANLEIPSGCCRQRFWMNVTDLGFENWILYPEGFFYYTCVGQCKNGFDSTVKDGTGLDYYRIMNAMIEKQKIRNIVPCCTPTKTSPFDVVVYNADNVVHAATIPNFIVDECACIGNAYHPTQTV